MGQAASSAVVAAKEDQNDSNPEVAWWCKLIARGLATLGAIIAIFTGIWALVTLTPLCLVAGIWQVTALVPICMCFGASTMFGSGCVFAAGVFYGLMALGKKGDRVEMAAKASNASKDKDNVDVEMNAQLIETVGRVAAQQISQHAYAQSGPYRQF
ncbi:PREDICTED: calcium channel flower-like isoform X3 [Priapulus caudatus]|uniref:Calcium channel flower n=1 Tax=Priapulus caudatus TaxID=37621 RepID=A0ABM1EB47_PRICU|nr:PREDICTED: calcium channel flower-like isoform X3 [Priapulus caudatus]